MRGTSGNSAELNNVETLVRLDGQDVEGVVLHFLVLEEDSIRLANSMQLDHGTCNRSKTKLNRERRKKTQTKPHSTHITLPHPPSPSLTLPHPPSPSLTLPHPPSPSLTLPHPPSPSLTLPHPPSPSLTLPHPPSPSLTLPHPPSPSLTLPRILIRYVFPTTGWSKMSVSLSLISLSAPLAVARIDDF